jgi:hypothetical protein
MVKGGLTPGDVDTYNSTHGLYSVHMAYFLLTPAGAMRHGASG